MLHAIIVVLGALMSGLSVMYTINPLNRAFTYFMNRIWPNALPSPSEAIDMYFRQLIDKKELEKILKFNGIGEEWIDKVIEASKRLYTVEMLVSAYFREIISEKEYIEEMRKLGYDEEKAKKIIEIAKAYPSVSDFVRFAVRDVFNDEAVEKYQLDAEFPESILEYVKRAGIDKEVFSWYWRAHWDLPSTEMVIRMVNMLQPEVLYTVLPDGTFYGEKYKDFGLDWEKLVTTYDDLKDYLRMADISPFWRDRIVALTFPPLNLVDLRRMYVLGLISDEELRARLLELGYSIKDVDRLIEFYKAYKTEHEKNLTKSEILKLYKERLISREDAKQMLSDIGYSEDEAEYLLELKDYELYKDILDEHIDALKRMYVTGLIDEQKVYEELAKLNLPDYKIQYELLRFQREKLKAQKMPTKSELFKMFKLGIISEEELRENLKKLGYSEKWIDKYIDLLEREAQWSG